MTDRCQLATCSYTARPLFASYRSRETSCTNLSCERPRAKWGCASIIGSGRGVLQSISSMEAPELRINSCTPGQLTSRQGDVTGLYARVNVISRKQKLTLYVDSRKSLVSPTPTIPRERTGHSRLMMRLKEGCIVGRTVANSAVPAGR